nr:hypothetical protein [Tanacetum cinerariifolium]
MDITIDQQVALDEALVRHASRLRIGKSNFRLRSDLKSKESTLQVVYDVLKLTPFYKAFLVTSNQFDELPFEEEILAFLRELGHNGEIKMITDVNINKLHQPWRSFAAVINKCLSGKSIGYDSLRLSQAQIVCGMYHKKNVDFAYLLWEDFVYQVEHKDAKNYNEMYYPRCTKVNINFFMTKDQSIPRRNKVNWHYARDDHMFTTIKLVYRHQNTQQYSAILLVELTNEAIINLESYKEYYAIASGAEPPKKKASDRKKQSSSVTTVPLTTPKGKRLKTSAKVDRPAKGKQPTKTSTAKGLTMLYEVALTEAEHIKLATKRSLTQTHISHASELVVDEGTGIIPGVPDVSAYESDDEEISWKSSDDDDDEVKISEHDDDVNDQSEDEDQDDDDQDEQSDDDDQEDQDDTDQEDQDDDDQDDQGDDNDEQIDSDNDGDDFVHPKFSTHDEETKDEESFDPIVRTPSHNDDDEDNDDSDGMNVEGDKGENEEYDADELYRDVNIHLEGRDIQMGDVQTTQVIEDTHVTLTPVNPEGIDSIFDSTLRVDVQVTTDAEPPLLSATTLSPPTISIIPYVHQTPAPSLANVPSSSLQDLPNFGSLFGFDHRLKTLKTNFSEFMQTNQFAKAVSSILDIVDKYIDHQKNEAVKVAVQLQSNRLRDEAQAKIKDFINKLDENIQKITKEQVKEQVKTSYIVAADLSELELKKIIIKKMESNKSIHRSDEQKNLYKALVDAYECDRIILDTYGDTVTLKRQRDDEDKDEEPFDGSNWGSKRRREGKEPESTSTQKEKTSKTSGKSTEGSKSQHKIARESAPHPHWFQKQAKPLTPDRAWNKTLLTTHGRIQPWISNLAKKADSRTSFNELMDTPIDFLAFVMNRLKVDTLTPELLVGPTYELMKVSCKSLVELEFFLEQVYKATTN